MTFRGRFSSSRRETRLEFTFKTGNWTEIANSHGRETELKSGQRIMGNKHGAQEGEGEEED